MKDHKISKGRNWARVLFLVLFIIGLPFQWIFFKSAEMSVIDKLFTLFNVVLGVLAASFLFTSAASAWFRRR